MHELFFLPALLQYNTRIERQSSWAEGHERATCSLARVSKLAGQKLVEVVALALLHFARFSIRLQQLQ
jgi:hypothetical protein